MRSSSIVPSVISKCQQGTFLFQVGDGKNNVDFTYVGNVIHAAFLSAQHIEKGRGEAFFITNDDPIPFWGMLSHLALGFGYKPPYIPLSYTLCYILSHVVEKIIALIYIVKKNTPLKYKLLD